MKFKNILIAAGAVLLLTQCKKYEDDPSIQLIPRETRLTQEWSFQSAYVDGENVSDQYNRYDLTIREDGTAYLDAEYEPLPGTEVDVNTNGTWTLKDDDETIEFDYEDDSQDRQFTITRLTLKEFRLRTQDDENREVYLRSN